MSKSVYKSLNEPSVAEEWTGLPDHTQQHPQIPPRFWMQSAFGTQALELTAGHPYHKLGKGIADIGGVFRVVRREYSEQIQPAVLNRTFASDTNASAYNFHGKYYPMTESVEDKDFPIALEVSDEDLISLGTTAISNVLPTNPINSAVVSLGELRAEGIPSLIGANTWLDRTRSARNAGSEYLNVQFGWMPLVSDIQGFAKTVERSDEIARQYEQNAGKPQRRRYEFPTDSTNSNSIEFDFLPSPALKVGYWLDTGSRITYVSVRTRTWFSGSFTYYLPKLGTNARDLAIAKKLYGARLTPDEVWNLTPWSWAVDWFTNMGDVIANASAFSDDGLVMPYGYIMSETAHEVTYYTSGAKMKRLGKEVVGSQTLTTTVKKRLKATPYGFGLDPSSLSVRQWSILAALGLSKGSRGMMYD